ncbi:mycothiol acetyltransferase [Nocardioides baekrokdamisoli]|uniref:Mycothiol synthase n=2 Tax=Nocardioides baekrokdamisoli TaxID=1804624 RepID=A0A3G9IDT8_9ACTN|nr:mycothiol acetyltransferase [Nocardioides baekrokdamisoli]
MNPAEVDRVLAIAAAAAAVDGVDHLDEAARLELEHRPEGVTGVVNENGFVLVTGSVLAMVVRPDRRGHERARALLARVPGGVTSAWSHSDHPAARHLAEEYGWRRDRELLRMVRQPDRLDRSSERSDDEAGTFRTFGRLRAFAPGDEGELLRVNAAAFAHHPEQGGLTLGSLEERMAESWFDLDDLIELWDGDRLAAFHWVKRQPDGPAEVYVLAVDPAYAGKGLGTVVLEAGLKRLEGFAVQLYVEADNTKARRLYESAGFVIAEVHAHYVR